ncbi:hypothetical protein EJ110_NYTH36668 [Nymphaea thermarum]|nr:hypothetical protein EJ110_NYTH36668 [Nymphaea thermarum]
MLNFTRLRSCARLVGGACSLQAARMLTPGAIISGFSTSGVRVLGPLDENAATTGDGLIPKLVPEKDSVAVGRGLVCMYRLISLPSAAPTAVAGRRWLSATSSSPLASDHANAARFLHHLTFLHPRIDSSVAEYNLPGYNAGV